MELSNNKIIDLSNNENIDLSNNAHLKVYTKKESDNVSKSLREYFFNKWEDKYNRKELENIPFLFTDIDRKQSVTIDELQKYK